MSALPQRKTIRLGAKDYEVRELQFGDYADLEELGVDLGALATSIQSGGKPSLRQMGTMLWVVVRRRASPEEKWRPDLEHFLHSFTMAEFNQHSAVIREAILDPLSRAATESTG